MPSSNAFLAPADRRRFIRQGAATTGGALALALLPGEAARAQPRLGATPFSMGVASGDPAPDGAVLWTRLAPEPLLADGGMPHEAVRVGFEVAADEAFTAVTRSGSVTASPELAHSVHLEVEGLEPGRVYFYRFTYRSEVSPVGRFKTAPMAGAPLARLDLAACSCQAWEWGYFTALRDIAGQDLDLVLHLGDYIYEYGLGNDNPRGVTLPAGFDQQIVSLDQYRLRHALYKIDPDLQAAHATAPFATIWDDHELENDYVGQDPYYLTADYLAQRTAAYQAYYEHLPLRRFSRPRGADMKIWRRLAFGDLAEISLLDTRQHRTTPPCGYGEQLACDERFETPQTMLGRNQEDWLNAGLAASTARWNVIAQQVLMAELFHKGDSAPNRFWTDSWDGFPAARRRLIRRIEDLRVSNPLVLTGDWHSTFVNDLKRNFNDEREAAVATELVTPAITTGGDGTPYGPYYGPFIAANPHIKYFEGDKRGWWKIGITPELMTADLRLVERVEVPGAPVATVRSFVVENGRPGAVPA